jgi:hypothetical protein
MRRLPPGVLAPDVAEQMLRITDTFRPFWPTFGLSPNLREAMAKAFSSSWGETVRKLKSALEPVPAELAAAARSDADANYTPVSVTPRAKLSDTPTIELRRNSLRPTDRPAFDLLMQLTPPVRREDARNAVRDICGRDRFDFYVWRAFPDVRKMKPGRPRKS